MGELKSAWELAQEKTRGLGSLSAEEIKKQNREEAVSIARFLVDRYRHDPNDRDLIAGVDKQDTGKKEAVRHEAIRILVESVELGKDETLELVAAGVRALSGHDVDLVPFKALLRDYRLAFVAVKQNIDAEGKALLKDMRISGSSVTEINPSAREDWQATIAEFARPYEARLDAIKQQALQQLGQ
jgi:hypothetical protein